MTLSPSTRATVARTTASRPGGGSSREAARALAGRLRGDPWRSALAVLAVVHVLAVALLSAGGGLYVDDIRAQAYAAGRSWWPFVVESNGTHLAPGARTVDWLMADLAPLAHWPAVGLTVVIALAYAAASLAVVHTALRDPRARVLGASWLLLVPALVPTYAWFRQAMTTMLPLALTMVAAVLLVRHLRSGRRGSLVGAVLAHALALTFSERALAVPVVLAALVLVVRREDGSRAWARGLVALGVGAVLNILFLLGYASGDFDRAERSSPEVGDAAVKLGRWVVVDLVPLLVGGPVTWRPGNGAYSYADTPTVLVVLAWALLLAGLVAVVRTRGAVRRAAPVLLVTAAYALPVLAMVYVGRLAVVETIEASDDLRLLPDVTVVCALALAALADAWFRNRRGGVVGTRRAAVVALVAAAGVLTVVSWTAFASRWHDSTVPAYLDTLRSQVDGTSGQVLPTTVPSDVVPGWVDPGFTTAPLVRLLDPGALSSAFDGPARVVGPDGALVPPRFGVVAGATVPEGFCGYVLPVGQRSLTVALAEDAPYFRGSLVQLGILVGDAERLNVRVTGRDGTTSAPLVQDPPELLRGPHRILAEIPPGVAVTDVVLDVETPNTDGVCITSAQVLTVEADS